MTIGDRIKQKRMELGLTVDELAVRLGKNRATIYRYEKNDIKDLPTTALEPLADALETTPAYLMGWEQEDSPGDIFDLYSTTQELIAAGAADGRIEKILASGLNNMAIKAAGDASKRTLEIIKEIAESPEESLHFFMDETYKILQEDLLRSYESLNTNGKVEALNYVEYLATKSEYTKDDNEMITSFDDTPDHHELNAAHERTDIEVTEEMNQHDDDIMNDDKEWE